MFTKFMFSLVVLLSAVINLNTADAAKKSKYTVTKFTKNNVNYEFHKYNKKNLFGLKKEKDKKWILKPLYNDIRFRGPEVIYTRKKTTGPYEVFSISTKKFQKTDIVNYFNPPSLADNTLAGSIPILYNKEKVYYVFKDDNSLELNAIPDVDENFVNEFGANILNIYLTPFSSLFIRHNQNGRKYYQAHLKDGTPVGKQYPAESVVYMMNDSLTSKVVNYVVPFEIINKERSIYWPILFLANDDNTITTIDRPAGTKGMFINPVYHWNDHYYEPKNLLKIPSFEFVEIVYNDESGKETLAEVDFNIEKLKNFYKIKDFLAAGLDERTGTKFTDLTVIKGKGINYRGGVYDRIIPILRKADGSYTYMARSGDDPELVIDSKERAIDILAARNQSIQQIANVKGNAYNKKENEIRQAVQENNQRTNQYFQDIRDSNAAEKQRADDQRKAANAEVWGRVGDQIQKAGQDASKRAKCINKRTQTKKDYLAGKQGWYDVGGCQ